MSAKPRPGTFKFTVRDVAEREGWSEQKSAAILRDGIDNGHYGTEKHRRENLRGIEAMKESGEVPTGRKGGRR